MKLEEVIDALYGVTKEDTLVVAIFGQISEKLYNKGDRNSYFYMRGGMGMASSIALGVSMADVEKKVVALDGDGSVIMNIGTFATIAHQKPKNLIHLIVDNHVHGSIGGYPTFTSDSLDLAKVASAFGIDSVFKTDNASDLKKHLEKIIAGEDGPHVVVAETEYEKSKGKGHAVRMVHIKERFMSAIRKDNPNLPDL